MLVPVTEIYVFLLLFSNTCAVVVLIHAGFNRVLLDSLHGTFKIREVGYFFLAAVEYCGDSNIPNGSIINLASPSTHQK